MMHECFREEDRVLEQHAEKLADLFAQKAGRERTGQDTIDALVFMVQFRHAEESR